MLNFLLHEVNSESWGGPIDVSILLPPEYDAVGEPYPLILQLHGGGGNRHHLGMMAPIYEHMFNDGTLRPCIVASLSGGATNYIGLEEFVALEFPNWVAKNYNFQTDVSEVCMTGVSMGGFGTLHVGLRYPEKFCAIAPMEPGIEPSFTPGPAGRRSTWWRADTSLVTESNEGEGVDMSFVEHSPARSVRDHADAIRRSGLHIYIEVGDEDYTNLHDGAEFLHRVLWDNDIPHEYHLVRWADHVGPSLLWRTIEAHRFIEGALGGGRSDDRSLEVPEEMMAKVVDAVMDVEYTHTKPDDRTLNDIFSSTYGASAHALMYAEMRATAEGDPDLKRHYGKLPSTE